MTSDRADIAKAAGFVLRRLAERMKLQLFADDGNVMIQTGLTIDEPEGFRFRVHDGVLGEKCRVASGFVALADIRRGGQEMVDAIELQLALAATELRGGVKPAMTHQGTFRVHFNRHGAAPLVWCVATEKWELAVASIAVAGAEVRTVYRPKATPDDEDGRPSAWLEVTGVLTVSGGEARITRSAG